MTATNNEPAPATRRDEYAATTRRAMLDAARELFAERGYEATTVAEIANRARVSPATVYAQAGGKHGLLETLMLEWSVDESVRDAPQRWAKFATGAEKLAQLASGTFRVYREYGQLIEIGRRAGGSSPLAADFVERTTARFRELLAEFVRQVREAGDLAEGLDDEDAVNILYFFFRYEQVMLATKDFGWSEDRARDWLRDRAASVVLAPRPR